MARRLLFLALAGAVAAGAVASRRWRAFDVHGDGSRAARADELRRRIEDARERLREDVERARRQE